MNISGYPLVFLVDHSKIWIHTNTQKNKCKGCFENELFRICFEKFELDVYYYEISLGLC